MNTLEVYSDRWRQVLQTLASRPRIDFNRDQDFDASKRLVEGAPVYSPFIRQEPDAV